MHMDSKKLWNQTKGKLLPIQVMMTESLIKKKGSYDICWICGDDDKLFFVKTKNEDDKVISGILCDDCIEIQKNKGNVFVEATQIIK